MYLLISGASCGLPTEAYLYAPERRTSLLIDPYYMLFDNNVENDPSIFRGYLVFYKMYSTSQATTDLEDFGESFFTTSRLNSYDIDDEQGVSSYVTLFKAINIDSGDRTTAFDVLLNFSAPAGASGRYPQTGTAIDEFDLYRTFARENVWNKDVFSTYSGDYLFSDPYNDSDLSFAIDASTNLTCAVWVVAYGFDIYDSFKNVYSEAVYIGQFTIPLS